MTSDGFSFANSSSGRFSVRSTAGHNLSCIISCPINSTVTKTTADVAVLCHGLFSSKDHNLITHLARNLPITTVRFDFHGNGESDGDNDWSFGGYWKEVDQDIRAVVQFLRSEELNVVMLIGHSRAAGDVLLYSMRFDDVPLVVGVAGRFDMARGITKHFGEAQMKLLEEGGPGSFSITSPDGRKRTITKKTIDDRLAIDMAGVSAIKKTALLLVHGTADDIIPYQDSEQIRNNVSSGVTAKVVLIDGAGHLFATEKERVALTAGVHKWLLEMYNNKLNNNNNQS
eukprot:GHVS01040772.1.p1 GENE.GHVS01040772.1~~GHVS01040772.1.p1  ORF type:complete len:285 (+),score=56.33 GHVS01040772.1:121-975(+)